LCALTSCRLTARRHTRSFLDHRPSRRLPRISRARPSRPAIMGFIAARCAKRLKPKKRTILYNYKSKHTINGGNVKRKLIRPRWTIKEIAILKKMYPTHSNAEIGKVLRKKTSSVVFKGHRLGLSKGPRRLKQMGRENIAVRWAK
jgi:hypothetical protein